MFVRFLVFLNGTIISNYLWFLTLRLTIIDHYLWFLIDFFTIEYTSFVL